MKMSTFDRENGTDVSEEELFRHYQAQYAETEPTHIANRLGLPFLTISLSGSASPLWERNTMSHIPA